MISLGETSKRLEKLKGWALEGSCIVKYFNFGNFKETMEFVNKVAEIAEENNHHPDMTVTYDSLRVSLTTKCEKTITEKDFDIAEKIDQLN